MKERNKITNVEVLKILTDLENNEELSMSKMYEAQLLLLLDIRDYLKKIYKESSNQKLTNIVTDPTKAKKNDVVVGKE